MIALSIDVLLLDKARFKDHTKKDGTKARYAELILIPTPGGQYGDYIVKQSVTKEEREAGLQLPILGNGRNIIKGAGLKPPAPVDEPEKSETDDAPF